MLRWTGLWQRKMGLWQQTALTMGSACISRVRLKGCFRVCWVENKARTNCMWGQGRTGGTWRMYQVMVYSGASLFSRKTPLEGCVLAQADGGPKFFVLEERETLQQMLVHKHVIFVDQQGQNSSANHLWDQECACGGSVCGCVTAEQAGISESYRRHLRRAVLLKGPLPRIKRWGRSGGGGLNLHCFFRITGQGKFNIIIHLEVIWPKIMEPSLHVNTGEWVESLLRFISMSKVRRRTQIHLTSKETL